ncbi:S1 RNA-binding domain-containing protein [Paraflavitalea speifideaquila]|uniref:S1 RNA-binding domain-containing protein n=1 Tax=Paraflavitalea speifideaquila TaxID=3076558 RepID=UPI0028EC69BE|nr:S1 RNA-binding domain-containing protein [Paraflavitalea speifideiaquila]
MTVPGIVTNITNFGVFVDIGVKQDGLVHISQLSNTFVSDPNQVVKLNQKVTVTVTEIDVARKRIALTMKDQSRQGSGDRQQPRQQSGSGGNRPGGNKPQQPKKQEPLNPFQAKLMELKKKFND